MSVRSVSAVLLATVLALVVTALVVPATAQGQVTSPAVAPASLAATPPTYVTLLFSRSAVAAADGTPCVPDARNVATLQGTVAPYLAQRGFAGTGTIQTGTTNQSTTFCTHYGETSAISWDAATTLATQYGWDFVSHSATFPTNWSKLTPARIQAETCGSAATLDSHGLPGAHGLFAWPSDSYTDAIQSAYVSTCFAFGRQYSPLPTTSAFALTPPYYQHTKGINGGACNDSTLPCYTIKARGNSGHYNLPTSIITKLRAMKPGDWYTIQVYLLVTGKSPTYRTNPSAWDCTSSDPRQHWTNDNERYCWNDYQRIVAAIPTTAVVTDPLTVAHLIGRPGY
jgi:hypothetical protein